jgi:NDP-sugar pyrophosphorylase family protein
MKAMILAAGFGKRLQPITHKIPKPLFPVMNQPALEHTIRLLQFHDFSKIIANVHHLASEITDNFGTKIQYSFEKEILGTAGGIKKAQDFLRGGPFLVINGDILTSIDLTEVIRFHKKRKALVTLVVREDPSPEKYPPIEINDEGKIVRFPKTNLPNPTSDAKRVMFTGAQIIEPQVFDRIPPDSFCGTTEDIYPKILEEELPVYGYLHKGYWNDIGNREDYLKAHWDIMDNRLPFKYPRSETLSSDLQITQPVHIGKNCKISPKAQLGPYVVLGDDCVVEDYAEVQNSVCWDNTQISEKGKVSGSVLAFGYKTQPGQTIVDQLVC